VGKADAIFDSRVTMLRSGRGAEHPVELIESFYQNERAGTSRKPYERLKKRAFLRFLTLKKSQDVQTSQMLLPIILIVSSGQESSEPPPYMGVYRVLQDKVTNIGIEF
jgi:hypothetical protein